MKIEYESPIPREDIRAVYGGFCLRCSQTGHAARPHERRGMVSGHGKGPDRPPRKAAKV